MFGKVIPNVLSIHQVSKGIKAIMYYQRVHVIQSTLEERMRYKAHCFHQFSDLLVFFQNTFNDG